MKWYKLVLAVGLMVCSASASSLQLERQHGKWTSGLIEKDDLVAFRAISSVERKTDVTVLFAFDILDDCKTVIPNLLVYIPEGVDVMTQHFLLTLCR